MKHRCYDGIIITVIILALAIGGFALVKNNYEKIDVGQPVQALPGEHPTPQTPATTTPATTTATSTSTTTPTTPFATHTLKIGQSFLYGDMAVTFTDVTTDSRCPANANCIWAGEFIAAVKITQGGDSKITSVKEYATTTTSLYKSLYNIGIVQVRPNKIVGETTNKTDYSVTFLIEHKK